MFDNTFIETMANALAPRLAAIIRPLIKQEPLPETEWLTRKQAAKYVGAGAEALRSMLRDGLFPVYHVKGRERIKRSDIDRAFLENKQYLQR